MTIRTHKTYFCSADKTAYTVVLAVRTYTIVDPLFGPVVLVGVLIETDVVEIEGFDAFPTTGRPSMTSPSSRSWF